MCVCSHIKEALRLDEEGLKKQALDEYDKGGSPYCNMHTLKTVLAVPYTRVSCVANWC